MSETLLNYNIDLFYTLEYARPALLLCIYLYMGPLFLIRFFFFYRTKAEAMISRGGRFRAFHKLMAAWVLINFGLKMFHTLYGIGFLVTVEHVNFEHSSFH